MENGYEKRGYLSEDFRLFHLKDDRGATVGFHYHEFYKVVFLLAGSGSYHIEGSSYQLVSGDIVLVGSRCVHRPHFEPGILYERVILYISPELLRAGSAADFALEDLFSGAKSHVLRSGDMFRRKMLAMTAQLEAEMSSSEPGASVLARCVLFEMLVRIAREMSGGPDSLPGPYAPKDEKIREIFEKDRLFFASLSSASEVLTQADREGIAEDAVSTLIHNASIFIPMEELVDIGKEIERLTKEKKRLEQELKRSRGMLQNEKFLSKAPAQKVEEEKGKLAKYEKLMEQVSERLSQLAR